MFITVVGAGMAGVSVARILAEDNHRVALLEKTLYIGGACREAVVCGTKIQMMGPHISHVTNNNYWVFDFFKRFGTLDESYIFYVNSLVNNQYYSWPLCNDTINKLPEQIKQRVINEHSKLPSLRRIDNFEHYMIDSVGPTLYSMFIEIYNSKHWGISPTEIEIELAQNRLSPITDDKRFFKNEHQGILNYTEFFENIIQHPNIKIFTKTNISRPIKSNKSDIIIWTGPLEDAAFVCPIMKWRGPIFKHRVFETDNYQPLAVITHPSLETEYIRTTEWDKLIKQSSHNNTVVTFEYPANMHLYPVPTKRNKEVRNALLYQVAKNKHIMLCGRLALALYLDTDDIIIHSRLITDIIPRWQHMTTNQRYEFYISLKPGM